MYCEEELRSGGVLHSSIRSITISQPLCLLGPHGAGLTNVILAPNATVMEMTMTPQCNRCFGHLAAALGNPYVALPQVTTFYHRKYAMTSQRAAIVARAVAEELHRRGQSHMLTDRSDRDEL